MSATNVSTAKDIKALAPRLAGVPVYVSDQERALKFYRDQLGYQVIDDQKFGPARWLSVARAKGDPVLILYDPSQWEGMNKQTELKDRIGTWTGIIFEVDDIHAAYEHLRAAGVRFEAEPKQQPWGGFETWFFDPDGNRFHLGQRL